MFLKVLYTKDLGIVFDSKMAFSKHRHTLAITRAFFSRLYLLLCCFHSRDRKLQIKLFYCFVRFILEYNSPVWSSHLKQNIKIIARVQKFFTKNLRGLKNNSYSQRLLVLNLPNLKIRRDIMICCSYIKFCSDIDSKSNT